MSQKKRRNPRAPRKESHDFDFAAWLKPAFDREKVICRIVAAWVTFAMFTLFGSGDGEEKLRFTDLQFAQDTSILGMIVTILLLFAAYTLLAAILPRFETDTWVLLIPATFCTWIWVGDYDKSDNQFIFLLAVLLAYALFLFYFLQKNTDLFDKHDLNTHVTAVLVGAVGLFGGIVIGVITCLRYCVFASPNFDFGLFCQMFHYLKTTGLPLCTSERNVLLSHFVVHVSPIYYLLLPFYFIFPSPLTLQIAQAVLVASGIVPVYLLCRHFKLENKTTLLVCVIYALYPALAGGCFYDIHENCFLTPILLWLFWFFEEKKTIPMYVFAVLLLMVKEDAAIYLVLFAIYLLLSRKEYKHGAILAAAALAWFGIAMLILEKTSTEAALLYAGQDNPSIAGPMINRFNNLIPNKDEGLLGAVKTMLFNPGFLLTQVLTSGTSVLWAKVTYFLELFLPVGFIPFCTNKQSRWLLCAPALMNLLTMYQYQYDIGFQYHFGIAAFLIYAMIVNLPDMKVPLRRNLLSFGAAACVLMYFMIVIPKMTYYVDRWDGGKETFQKMDAVLDTLPEDASMCVSTSLLAHVHDRDILYEINYNTDEVKGEITIIHADVDYVVFDARSMSAKNEKQKRAFLDAGFEVDERYADVEDLILVLRRVGAE